MLKLTDLFILKLSFVPIITFLFQEPKMNLSFIGINSEKC